MQNLLMNSVKICQSYLQKFTGTFSYGPQCIIICQQQYSFVPAKEQWCSVPNHVVWSFLSLYIIDIDVSDVMDIGPFIPTQPKTSSTLTQPKLPVYGVGMFYFCQ